MNLDSYRVGAAELPFGGAKFAGEGRHAAEFSSVCKRRAYGE
jgi:hypothetical protein